MCKTKTSALALAVFGVLLPSPVLAAVPFLVDATTAINGTDGAFTGYSGNVAGSGNGFGGQLGDAVNMSWDSDATGNLILGINDTVSTCAFADGSQDAFVFYIDSRPGGFNSTATLNDRADLGRSAATGKVGAFTSDITFATGFEADFALVLGYNYQVLFELVAGGDNSLIVTRASGDLTRFGGVTSCVHEVSGFTLANLGITGSGGFKVVGTLLNRSNAYRSNEFQGCSAAQVTGTIDGGGPNYGNNAITLGADCYVVVQPFTNIVTLSGTAAAINFANYTGTGFNDGAPSAAGKLSTDNWEVSGSGGNPDDFTFDSTPTAAVFAQGQNAAAQSAGGLWSFLVQAGNSTFGVQPSANFFGITAASESWATLRLQNLTNRNIVGFRLQFSTWIRDDQGRGLQIDPYVSHTNSAYAATGAIFNTTSTATGTANAGAVFVKKDLPTSGTGTLTLGTSIAPNSFAHIRFYFIPVGTSGSQDEAAIDDIVVTPIFQAPAVGIVDFGDAPNTYGTTLASDGARHSASPIDLRLGTNADGESDGPASGNGTQDDTTGSPDDEDGVAMPATLTGGSATNIPVTVSNGNGAVSAWIDWNRDGDFGDAGEQVANGTSVNNTTAQLAVTPPVGLTPGATYARFRVASSAVASPIGAVTGGEVEDYAVTLACGTGTVSLAGGACQFYDFGDLADSYGTLIASGGAAHAALATGPHLGEAISYETNGQPALGANLDTSDDALAQELVFTKGETVNVPFTVTTNGSAWHAAIWVDRDLDGEFSAFELVDEVLGLPAADSGSFDVDISNGQQLFGTTGVRIRIASDLGADPDSGGPYPNGEVEDYIATIESGEVADLELTTFSVDDNELYAGEATTLDIAITNLGPVAVNSAEITFNKPAGATLVLSGLPCIEGTANVTCDLGAIAASAIETLEIPLVALAAPTVGSTTLTVSLIEADNKADANASNNVGADTVDIDYCGDSELNGAESCDDGDTSASTPNAGCSAACVEQSGWDCVGAGPTSCERIVDVTASLTLTPSTIHGYTNTFDIYFEAQNTGAIAATNLKVVLTGVGDLDVALGSACVRTNATTVTCSYTSLPAGVTQTGTLATKVVAPFAGTSIDVTMTVTHDNPDPTNNTDTATLTFERCGDDTVNGPEECDDGAGNGNGPDQCRTSCLNPSCGDGVLDTGESCDDGNTSGTLPNAGCSAACVADEENFACDGGSPTVCVQRVNVGVAVFEFSKASVYANGEAANLRLSLTNAGPGNATNVKAKLTKPTHVTLGALPAGCVLVDAGANIECTFNTIAQGATTGVFSIPVTAPSGLEQSPSESEVLQITQNGPEKDPADNTAEASMVVHYCGDSAIQATPGEQCDDGNAQNLNEPNKCRVDCKLPRCGDNIIDTSATYGSEVCDDGNSSNNDSCPTGTLVDGHPLCKPATCGDAYVFNTGGGTETCDDGDNIKTDDCPDGPDPDAGGPLTAGTCKLNVCGDGHRDLEGAVVEGCDDGNASNADACPSGVANAGHPLCVPATCGDSYVFTAGGGTETCDDGNGDQNDDCPDGATGSCKTSTCGDGYVNFKTLVNNAPKEDCDQRGNTTPDDGCTATCDLEPGYTCLNTGGATPSQTCTQTCLVSYDFATAAHNFVAGGAIFQYGSSTKFGPAATGWFTQTSGNLPTTGVVATLAKSVAVPSLDRGRAPVVDVDVQQTMGAGDCTELHVSTNINTSAATQRDIFCGTGSRTLTTSLASTPNQSVIITIVVRTVDGPATRLGTWVKAVRFESNVDNDAAHEVRGLTCSDACVDGDGDLYADPITSGNRSLCTGGVSTTKDDCNDLVATIRPDIDETNCTDGIDNNCDNLRDVADQFCFEICGDNIDNGKKLDGTPAGNGVDCADAACRAHSYTIPPSAPVNVAADPFCATPCLLEWTFDRGGVWAEETSGADIFEPLGGSDAGWTTGPTNDANRQVARLQYTLPSFGNVAQRGPAPRLVVDFTMVANPTGRDIFAVCIENKTCEGTTQGITKLTEVSTGGRVSRSVDLTPWLGNAGPDGALDITLLFDTNEQPNGNPTNVQLDIFNIRLQSDVDGDALVAGAAGGYEGTVAPGLSGTCDQCWDADKDGYGLQTSPNITTCCFSSGGCVPAPGGCSAGSSNPACFDCNDDPTPGKGANAHPPQSADEGLCGDTLDNNCNGLTDGADPTCGLEDCANRVDDNGDNAVDCADASCSSDPACSPCELSFELEKGRVALEDSAGFLPSVGGILEWGSDPNQFGGAGGWWTVKEGNLSLVQNQGPVKATLSREIVVSTAYERPTVELEYELRGSSTFLGLCIDKPASQCGTATPANLAWSTPFPSPSTGTRDNPVNLTFRAGDRDHTFVPIPKGTHTIVIVFESEEVSVDGLFLDAVRIRSDIDLDDKGEATSAICDHCVDFDGDGRGTNNVGVADLTTCPVPFDVDCDDRDLNAYPRAQEQLTPGGPGFCFVGGVDISDDDCDGDTDPNDPDCNTCGDGRIGQGETCDPPRPGQCSDQCQLVASSAVFVSEIHYPILFGERAEQWLELYNPADQPVDVLLAGLKIMVCSDDPNADPPAPNRNDCRQVSFKSEQVGGNTILPACQIVGARTTIGNGAPGDPRYFVITFGPPEDSAFFDTSIIDAACNDPTFSLPDGDEWLLIEAGTTNLDGISFGDFDECLFANQEVVTGFESRGRSLVLEDIAGGANGNDNPSQWCLAGRDQVYANTNGHLGSPGTAGGCAEVVCDGVDDDCDQGGPLADRDDVLLDEGLELAAFDEDDDGDGVCDAMDCAPTVATCTYDTNPDPSVNPCTDDADSDGAPDCRDTCFDIDKDGYGDVSRDTSGCVLGQAEASACDGDGTVNPGVNEADNASCTDDKDNDCDGFKNCLDSACENLGTCLGETCAEAIVVECGYTAVLTANSEDFPTCDVGGLADPQIAGRDKVFRFVAPSSAAVSFRAENLGSRRHELYVMAGGDPAADDTCSETSCDDVIGKGAALCADAAQVQIAEPVAGETYAIIMKGQGTCNLGVAPTARFTVVCSEECGTDGVDEDKDGLADCADVDCALEAACGELDQDNDGVSSADEIVCLCPNFSPDRPEECPAPQSNVLRPSDDDVRDLDDDQLLNCVDDDDDGDLASDDVEGAACADPLSKNNPLFYPARDLCTGQSCGAAQGECCTSGTAVENQFCRDQGFDANCNGAIDTTEAGACDTQESNCGDLIDDDFDGSTDCDDFDCVRATLCGEQDRDGDCVTNRVEIICNTSPTVAGMHIAGIACADGGDTCSFAEEARFQNSDGASLFPDSPLCPNPLPADCDGTSCVPDDVPNCDDGDDDGDLYDDVQETVCGSDNLDASSLPPDLDGDHQCDDTDEDDDDDGFIDLIERNCALDADDRVLAPRDPTSTPDDLLHDTDQDGTCNALDDDIDGDGWLNVAEDECLTDPVDVDSNPTRANQDVDGDFRCNLVDDDDDGDTWLDILETPTTCGTSSNDPLDVPEDTDGDLQCNPMDTDDDNDGVQDLTELGCQTDPEDITDFPTEGDAQDEDGDDEPNCIDLDDDGDLVSDANERILSSDPLERDSDGDGLDDGEENVNHDAVVDPTETSPTMVDTDSDGIDDLTERESGYPSATAGNPPEATEGWIGDSDGDGVLDGMEDTNHDGNRDAGEMNPRDPDSDDDTFSDGDEVRCATDPLNAASVPVDRDDNGVCDGQQVELEDCDSDGVADGVEVFCGFGECDASETPSFADLVDTNGDGDINCVDSDDDADGFNDTEEITCGTDPRLSASIPTDDGRRDYDEDGLLNCIDPDDDNDGVTDIKEGQNGTDAQDQDSDDDGLSDKVEADIFTNPLDVDTDGDGVQDGTEKGVTAGTKDTDVNVFIPDADPSTQTDPLVDDSDGDGVDDGTEDENSNGRVDPGEGDPNNQLDGLNDTDDDGLIDRDEADEGTDPEDPDTDDDGLEDGQEVHVHTTDPLDADSDDGGVQDGFEIENKTDPKVASDDYTDAKLEGDTIFGCGGGQGEGLVGLALGLAVVMLMLRRRARGAK